MSLLLLQSCAKIILPSPICLARMIVQATVADFPSSSGSNNLGSPCADPSKPTKFRCHRVLEQDPGSGWCFQPGREVQVSYRGFEGDTISYDSQPKVTPFQMIPKFFPGCACLSTHLACLYTHLVLGCHLIGRCCIVILAGDNRNIADVRNFRPSKTAFQGVWTSDLNTGIYYCSSL